MFELTSGAVFLFLLSGLALAEPDVTGVWTANDGGTYYIRQIQNVVWWLGWAPAGANDFDKGIGFTNVFRGVITGNTITGEWADVPRGQTLGAGALSILIIDATTLQRQTVTGGFSGSVWQKLNSGAVPDRNIWDTLDSVKKNQNAWRDHSLLDNLKPAKRFATIFGDIVPDTSPDRNVHVNYPPSNSRSYFDFICLNGNNSPPDGDLNATVTLDRPKLDSQPGFWTSGWEIWDEDNLAATSDILKAKINRFNEIHGESIMYGRTAECNDGNYDAPALLPGWQEFDSNSVLVNGIPLNGRMGAVGRDANSMNVISLLGDSLAPGRKVRLSGTLVLDCGHGIRRNCNEEDTSDQNQEIHPVYAIDILQDFHGPRPAADLTGVWSADDVGTYYVHQIGNAIWWLGLSQDQGRTFANILKGQVRDFHIDADWTDVQVYGRGSTNNGTLTLVHSGPSSLLLNRLDATGNFGARTWEKLYDLDFKTLAFTFEKATVSVPDFSPVLGDEFEISVNDKTTHVMPQNPRPVVVRTVRSTLVDLGARMSLRIRTDVPLYLVVRYEGWRLALSSLDYPSDFAPGEHTLRLAPPPNPPPPPSLPGPVVKPPYDRDGNNPPTPDISITYRLDLVIDAENQINPAR